MLINVKENIFEQNDRIADDVHDFLRNKNIFTVNVLGSPGAGKTSVLLQIISRLPENIVPFVVEGDLESDIDAKTFERNGVHVIQINTGGTCHLNAHMLKLAIDNMDFDLKGKKGLLFVENIGNLVCTAEFNIGEDIKMLICSTTEGSDKPYKYPFIFQNSDIIILNKYDLKEYVDFDEAFFNQGIADVTGKSNVFTVTSRKEGQGFEPVIEYFKLKTRALLAD